MGRFVSRFLPVLAGILVLSSSAFAAGPPRKKARLPRPAPAAVPLDAASVNASGQGQTIGPKSRGPAVLRAQILLARARFS
ncbi:MAG TPA: hypothetical protein VIZ58_11330, partial [Thermoanaerobaculia bacterium]